MSLIGSRMTSHKPPTNKNGFGSQDPNVDKNFLVFVAVALACFIALMIVLFPRGQQPAVGPGAPATPKAGGGGPPSPATNPPPTSSSK